MPSQDQQSSPQSPQRKQKHNPPSKPKRTGWIGCLSLVLLSLIAFFPVTGSDLLWSPHDAVDRTNFQSLESWTEAWSLESIRYGDPITTTSYFVESALPFPPAIAHRAINLFLHILAAILLLRLLTILELPGALAAAMVFALHPAVVQPAFWPGYRTEFVGLIFILLSLQFGVRNRDSMDLALMLVFTAIASVLHPAALVLPLLVGLCIFYKKDRLRLRDYNCLLPAICLVLFVGIWTHSGRPAESGPEGLESGTPAGANLYHYIEQTFVPSELSLFYPVREAGGYSLSAHNSLLPFLLLVPFFLLIAIYFRQRWARGLLMGSASFSLMLTYGVSRSGQFIDGTPALENYGLYVALPFALALVICGLTAFFRFIHPKGNLVSSALVGVLLLIEVGLTRSHAGAISDTTRLWEDLAEAWPESAAAKIAMIDSAISTESDRLSESEQIETLEQILEKRPDQVRHRILLARIYRAAGQDTNALREYRRVLRESAPGAAFLEEAESLFKKHGLHWEAQNVRERIEDATEPPLLP